MSIRYIDLTGTDFVPSIPDLETKFEDRRFLLIPIEGCGQDYTTDQAQSLEPLRLSDFGEDNGWSENTISIITELDLGESVKQFDGIAQAQVVVRVV